MGEAQFETTIKYLGNEIVITIRHIETGLYKGHTIFLEPEQSRLKYELVKLIDPVINEMIYETTRFVNSLSEEEYQKRLAQTKEKMS